MQLCCIMIRKWLKIIRAHTLFASACPVLVGGMVYLFTTASVSWLQVVVLFVTMLCAMTLQVLANLINDYYDYKQGADRAGRAGYARPLAEGALSEKTMLRAVYITAIVAVVLGVFLVAVGKMPILLIGISTLFFAWLYTVTRYSLAYLGLGDLFVLIFYGLVAAWGTGYLLATAKLLTWERIADWHAWQSLTIQMPHTVLLLAGAVNGLLSMLVLAANNLRDIADDRPVGKRTFPVRFGKRAGEVLVLLEVLAMPVCAYFAFGWSLPMLILIPGAYWVRGLWKAKGEGYNRYLEKAGKLNVLYTLSVLIQLIIHYTLSIIH